MELHFFTVVYTVVRILTTITTIFLCVYVAHMITRTTIRGEHDDDLTKLKKTYNPHTLLVQDLRKEMFTIDFDTT